MRDPRLVEIEFLVDADTVESMLLQCPMDGDGSFVQIATRKKTYGLDGRRFRDLIIELLIARAIVPRRPVGRPEVDGSSEQQLAADRSNTLRMLTLGYPIELAISHAGRLRLWTLRDELLRDPEMDAMGLMNRAAWNTALPLRLQWATADEPLTIMFFDIDHFKLVNDELGHWVGDLVLAAVFELAKNLVGSRGAVYRYGGEEVGVLLPNMPLESGKTVAEELRAVVAGSVHKRVTELGDRAVTVSIGVATFAERVSPESAVKLVDELMYQAKREGRNRVIAMDSP